MIRKMTNEEINNRINELTKILNGQINENWRKAYDEYCELSEEQNRRYRIENRSKFETYYEENIKGKTWDEIDSECWNFYSDWHKDMYGFRPKTI